MAKKFCREKSENWLFGPFWSKIGHFSPKMAILTYFFKSNHRILLIFAIETRFLVLKKWRNNFCLQKSENWLFGPVLVNNTLLVVPKCVFRPFLTIFLQSVDVLWSSFVIWTVFMVYMDKEIWNSDIFGLFWTLFWSKNWPVFGPK